MVEACHPPASWGRTPMYIHILMWIRVSIKAHEYCTTSILYVHVCMYMLHIQAFYYDYTVCTTCISVCVADNHLQPDETLSGVKSSSNAEEIHVHHSTLSTGSQSLNNSFSSEHSEASSVSSHVSLSATGRESRGEQRAVEPGPPGARRVGGKIPKPSAK